MNIVLSDILKDIKEYKDLDKNKFYVDCMQNKLNKGIFNYNNELNLLINSYNFNIKSLNKFYE